MFNLNPAQSTIMNGTSQLTSRLGETSDAAVLQPFIQATQAAFGVEQQRLGLEVSKEQVGWTIYGEAVSQYGKFVAQG